jgi:phage baseplate assembly protein W
MAEWQTLDTLPKEIVFGTSGIQEVMQNVKLIIMTRKGTQPLDRDFGISFDFLDSPMPRVQAKVEQEIFMALRKYEPRAVLKQIMWNSDPISGSVKPNVSIQVRL